MPACIEIGRGLFKKLGKIGICKSVTLRTSPGSFPRQETFSYMTPLNSGLSPNSHFFFPGEALAESLNGRRAPSPDRKHRRSSFPSLIPLSRRMFPSPHRRTPPPQVRESLLKVRRPASLDLPSPRRQQDCRRPLSPTVKESILTRLQWT